MAVLRGLKSITGNLLVFATTDLLGNFARGMVFPYASLFVLALGGDAAQIGIIAFVSQLAGLVLLPIAGYITDHVDRVKLIVVAGFLSSAFQLLLVFAPNWQMIAVSSLLIGTVVFQFPAYASLVADSLSPHNRGQGLGLLNTISSSLAIVAPYIAGLILDRFSPNLGMRILYSAMLVLSLVATLIQLFYLKEVGSHHRVSVNFSALLKALRQAYKDIPGMVRVLPRPLKILAGVIVLTFITNGLTGNFWVVYVVNQIGLNATEWGIVLLVESIVKTLLFLPAGYIVDRMGRSFSLLLSLIIFTLACPLFILSRGLYQVMAVRSLFSIAFVLGIPACTALMADLIPRAMRGQLMAALGQGGILPGMVGSAGGPAVGYVMIPPLMLSSLAGGFIYTWNPTWAWIISAIIGVVAILLVGFFIRDPKVKEI